MHACGVAPHSNTVTTVHVAELCLVLRTTTAAHLFLLTAVGAAVRYSAA